MISPEKHFKNLGKKKLKIGISMRELLIASMVPLLSDIAGLSGFAALGLFFVVLATLVIRARFFEKRHFSNLMMRDEEIRLERIRVLNDKWDRK